MDDVGRGLIPEPTAVAISQQSRLRASTAAGFFATSSGSQHHKGKRTNRRRRRPSLAQNRLIEQAVTPCSTLTAIVRSQLPSWLSDTPASEAMAAIAVQHAVVVAPALSAYWPGLILGSAG